MHDLVKNFFKQRAISTDIDMNKPLHNSDKMIENNIDKLEKNVP